MSKRWAKAGVTGFGLLIACAPGCQPDRAATATATARPLVASRTDPLPATAAPAAATQSAAAKVADDAAGLQGGYLIGMTRAMIDGHRHDLAKRANDDAQQHPAGLAEAKDAATADLNNDGFVTLDEVVALRRAGLNEQQMLERLRATRQVFAVSARQRQYLLDRGIPAAVLDRIVAADNAAVATGDRVH